RALRKSRLANEVVVARDGVEALNYLFGRAGFAGRDTRIQPALILLDVRLPKVDGIEVLRAIRADPRTSQVHVVMLTGSSEQEMVARAFESGVDCYIAKPMDFAQLIEAASQVGACWLIGSEQPRALVVRDAA